ncbi:hypothetical protein JNK13_08440 [bacterium]|nr:hypothetical protein [bacterium]
MKLTAFILALSGLLLLTACSATLDDGQTLRNSVVSFHEALRWHDADKATVLVEPKEREAFYKAMKGRLDKEKIISYEVRDVSIKESEARVLVDIKSYAQNSLVVNTRTEVQAWIEDSGAWYFVESRLAADS